jgi:hypothetical protein
MSDNARQSESRGTAGRKSLDGSPGVSARLNVSLTASHVAFVNRWRRAHGLEKMGESVRSIIDVAMERLKQDAKALEGGDE